MKSGPDRKYTDAFRADAVQQVLEGKRPLAQVARSLEMSGKTLDTWVKKARKGQPLLKRLSTQPLDETQAELTRLRQEIVKLRLEKEILRKAAAYFARESL